MRDKRCAICREVFTPTNNAQMLCGRCKPYYYETGLYRTGNIKEARALFMRDMKKQKIKVSDYPAAPGCEGCKYWKPISVGGRACHYCIDEKTSRPCLPGRNCTVRVNKKKGEKQTCEFSE